MAITQIQTNGNTTKEAAVLLYRYRQIEQAHQDDDFGARKPYCCHLPRNCKSCSSNAVQSQMSIATKQFQVEENFTSTQLFRRSYRQLYRTFCVEGLPDSNRDCSIYCPLQRNARAKFQKDFRVHYLGGLDLCINLTF